MPMAAAVKNVVGRLVAMACAALYTTAGGRVTCCDGEMWGGDDGSRECIMDFQRDVI